MVVSSNLEAITTFLYPLHATKYMKQKQYTLYPSPLIIAIIAVITLIAANACSVQEAKENPSIEDIVRNPGLYEGRTVTMDVLYAGWHGATCNNEPKIATKSDVTVYDKTGYCLAGYGFEIIEGSLPNPDPSNESNVGKEITIRTEVKVRDGKPILG